MAVYEHRLDFWEKLLAGQLKNDAGETLTLVEYVSDKAGSGWNSREQIVGELVAMVAEVRRFRGIRDTLRDLVREEV